MNVSDLPIFQEIEYLASFCASALDKIFNFNYFDHRGIVFVIGFFLIWLVIDNFVPKG